jgi:hypothetical protein
MRRTTYDRWGTESRTRTASYSKDLLVRCLLVDLEKLGIPTGVLSPDTMDNWRVAQLNSCGLKQRSYNNIDIIAAMSTLLARSNDATVPGERVTNSDCHLILALVTSCKVNQRS